MVIFEKGLIKAMKAECKKKDGYTVALDNGIYTITGENWFVTIEKATMSKELKSVIMLHAGYLPEDGTAIQIQKDVVQSDFVGSACELANLVQGAFDVDRNRRRLKRVEVCRIQMDGNYLMQGDDMHIIAVDQDDALPLLFNDRMYLESGCVYSQAGLESVGVRKLVIPDSVKVCIRHLEQMQWVPGACGLTEAEEDDE